VFYGTAVELAVRSVRPDAKFLDLGAGTGLLSELMAERLQPGCISLVDASGEMLARARARLSRWSTSIHIQELTAPLPTGPYDAVVSALAIHHLSDNDKRDLFAKILLRLVPGGVFINAEQVRGTTEWQERLFESTHLDQARALGSSGMEISEAIRRMSHDRCTPLSTQLEWLRQNGYERVDCFFQWFRFAVFAGWKPAEA
jgi:tRNA (cmo5U34)-methyltransferase